MATISNSVHLDCSWETSYSQPFVRTWSAMLHVPQGNAAGQCYHLFFSLLFLFQGFAAPALDDRLMEVVAVIGTRQMATSKVLGIQQQHNRIAQCRHVRITIVGEDPVPIQVDGEAWLQPPGELVISHKNRAQMLVRDKVRLSKRVDGNDCFFLVVWLGVRE